MQICASVHSELKFLKSECLNIKQNYISSCLPFLSTESTCSQNRYKKSKKFIDSKLPTAQRCVLSVSFTTMAAINPPERKLTKRTFVHRSILLEIRFRNFTIVCDFPCLFFLKLRLGAQSNYVVKYFEGSNAVKTTSMGN